MQLRFSHCLRNDNKQKLDFHSLQLGGDVNAQAPNGDSVLYDAARSGNPDCIDLLLRHGANPNVPSLCSELPIHRAAYEGHYLGHVQCLDALHFTVSIEDVTCTEMLLNAGAKPDLDRLFCLLVEVRDGQYEIVKLLLARQADINCYFAVVSDSVSHGSAVLPAGRDDDASAAQRQL
uniref:Uncharacterized protein n=1 Tax=Hucho hucho TaxID=62062 RepID=A0A4W5PDU0_9TELE